MANKSPSIARITAPVVPSVVPRERLFHLLDTERETPVVWVTRPAGSGKTILVASYLDSRKLPGLPTFTRHPDNLSQMFNFFKFRVPVTIAALCSMAEARTRQSAYEML